MRIPRYWATGVYSNVNDRGKQIQFTAWGWSFNNIQEAEQEASRRASRIFQRFTSGAPLERYPYLDTPMREEIVEDVRDSIILTRNRYGLILIFPKIKARVVDCSKNCLNHRAHPIPSLRRLTVLRHGQWQIHVRHSGYIAPMQGCVCSLLIDSMNQPQVKLMRFWCRWAQTRSIGS
jgi:hypothetical protein